MRKLLAAALATAALAFIGSVTTATASTPGADVRLTTDRATLGGYVSAYTLGTGNAYTDGILDECSVSRGRQNEPYVAVDPRNTNVLIGSSNDYCGVFGPPGSPSEGNPAGPIWLGYYRSQDGGSTFRSSLVPGYPGDTSPFAALAQINVTGSGDPTVAWDAHGRAFIEAQSDIDINTSNGSIWVARYENSGGSTINDGKLYKGTVTVASGSAAPNLLGKFADKTALNVDRTGGTYDGNVYSAWTRFTGGTQSNIYFSRSTDHGVTFSNPMSLTPSNKNLQDPQIAITSNGHVYITFDTFETPSQPNGFYVAKSTDGGKTFSQPALITTYTPADVQDEYTPSSGGGSARDCGDTPNACVSGYTFFRQSTILAATGDQYDAAHEYVYMVYHATRPGSEVNSGTTFGIEDAGVGGQEVAYFVRYNGATGAHTTPALLSNVSTGHQVFPAVSADGGVLHVMWWDSRNDPTYSKKRPPGNSSTGGTHPALDVYARSSTNFGGSWGTLTKITDSMSNPNFEQFSDRTVPFAGDYLWVTSYGSFAFGAWTDWRNVVTGGDPREGGDSDADGADVKQCRTFDSDTQEWGPDTCPHSGGLDQNIYGDKMP